MAKIRYVQTRHHLVSAAESLSVAYWTQDRFHVRNARGALTLALCGGDFDILVECIEETMRQNPDGPAYAVALALLDYAVPTPEVENGES